MHSGKTAVYLIMIRKFPRTELHPPRQGAQSRETKGGDCLTESRIPANARGPLDIANVTPFKAAWDLFCERAGVEYPHKFIDPDASANSGQGDLPL